MACNCTVATKKRLLNRVFLPISLGFIILGVVFVIVNLTGEIKDSVKSKDFLKTTCRVVYADIDNSNKQECTQRVTRHTSVKDTFSCIIIKVFYNTTSGGNQTSLLHDDMDNMDRKCSKIVCGKMDEWSIKDALRDFYNRYNSGSYSCLYDKTEPSQVTIKTHPMTPGEVAVAILWPLGLLIIGVGGILLYVFLLRNVKRQDALNGDLDLIIT